MYGHRSSSPYGFDPLSSCRFCRPLIAVPRLFIASTSAWSKLILAMLCEPDHDPSVNGGIQFSFTQTFAYGYMGSDFGRSGNVMLGSVGSFGSNIWTSVRHP